MNIASGYGLLPDDSKPKPILMLTTVTRHLLRVQEKCLTRYQQKCIRRFSCKIIFHISQGAYAFNTRETLTPVVISETQYKSMLEDNYS